MPASEVPRLLGRGAERAVLDQVLSDARAGRSRVLVLRGEAGVGKTALLDDLATAAAGFDVVRTAGVESEMELAFAGLHQICVPLLDRLDHLPGPQRAALGTAFGLEAGGAPDRFMVGLALLSLWSDVAEQRPLLVVVDDAHWLDRASAQVLAFTARRLLAEAIAVVVAVRQPGVAPELLGLPDLSISGLRGDDAGALLDLSTPGRLDERVRDRILAEARGNPLAILELNAGRDIAELAGGFAPPPARPLSNEIEQSFRRRLEQLPTESQRLLVIAAAEPVGDTLLVRRAARQLGIAPDAEAAAEAAGLIEFDPRVRFRHPLVRSAAYRSADRADRQAVHRALADATDPAADPDRRAWHRAQGARGPDEDVAVELERSAERAERRGGVAAAAAFLARATELTPDPARRSSRALAAAQSKFEAAALDQADELLATAELGGLGSLQQAQLERLRAQIVFARRRGRDAPPALLDAAKGLEGLDDALSRDTYVEALGAAIFVGRLNGPGGLRVTADIARGAPPAAHPPRPVDLLLDGLTTRFTQGYGAGVAPLRRMLAEFRHGDGSAEDDIRRWLWMAWLVAGDMWDDETWESLADRAIQVARDAGALTTLPVALEYRAGVHIHAGEFAAASALVDEAESISQAMGATPVGYSRLLLGAWRGDVTPFLALLETATRDGAGRGEGRFLGFADYVTAVLNNGLGRYPAALAAARRACEHDDLSFYGFSLIELVEAAVRDGAVDVAADAVRHLEERALATGTDWGLGVLARSRALLADGDVADSLYREAIERLTRSRIVVHRARTHLLYGEWLRREHRRVDAREQLRTSYEMLSRIGVDAFAERARRELAATGESVRVRTTASPVALTPQELQIATLTTDGSTNQEIGSQLFISPRTVEYHLHKVFAKLQISSRRELRGALALLADQASS